MACVRRLVSADIFTESERSDAFLRVLDDDLAKLKLFIQRRNHVSPDYASMYLPREPVRYQCDPDVVLPSNMTMPFEEPFKVIEQTRNQVNIHYLATHGIKHVSMVGLEIFHGDHASAVKSANVDKNQNLVQASTERQGEPKHDYSKRSFILSISINRERFMSSRIRFQACTCFSSRESAVGIQAEKPILLLECDLDADGMRARGHVPAFSL